MQPTLDWMIPALAALGGALGAWVAIKVAVAKLELRMEDVRERQTRHGRRLAQHNDDLLVHDIEIEMALHKLQLPRARRQRVRESDDDGVTT